MTMKIVWLIYSVILNMLIKPIRCLTVYTPATAYMRCSQTEKQVKLFVIKTCYVHACANAL